MWSLTKKDLLNYAIENGIIDISTIQTQVEMNERHKYLEKHNYRIWQSETDKLWRTYLPDDEKGRKLIKRKTQKEIEDLVVKYYYDNSEELRVEREAQKMTLLKIFPKLYNIFYLEYFLM